MVVGAGEALAQVVMMGVPDPPIDASLQAPMEDPPITASLGPIDRLICRLKSLEGSKHTLPVGLRVNQIGKLRKHLERFRKPLKNLSEMEETSFRAKWWMKEVRELCYDTEDYLVQSGAGVHRPLGRIARIIISWIHKMLKWRTKLSKFMARSEALKKTCEQIIDKEIKAAISLKKEREPANSHGKENKVDIETLPAQLVHMLAFEDDKQSQLKVVTISGLAGSGKTTLARNLYMKCKKKFRCSAFVRISRNPDFRSLLTSILSQIKAPSPQGFSDVQGLMRSISDHLQGKRYFIVIDDVRSPSVWDIISCAFPGGNFISRIIVTTQSEEVEAAYFGYKLKSSIFKMGAIGDGCSHTTTKEKSKVLNIRYNNLPVHLKTCLLYLGMHPEGCTITKDDLVKQWVAEVFIPALKSQDTEKISEIPQNKREEILEITQYMTEEIAEVPQDKRDGNSQILQDQPEEIAQVNQDQREEIAEGYFDELVTRGMIQPVDRNHKGEVLSCTVHHMVLDLIRYKSKEDNFLVVLDNLESTLGHPDIVRRLSVQFGCEKGASIPESIILSQVRSLTFYGLLECVPSIADYGLLRVLNLHIWANEGKIFDLTRTGELCHLIYLRIECNIKVRLPLKIRRLEHLGTLELHAEVESIPSDIGHLKKLLHVCCPSKADVRDLGDLTSLLDFHLTCSTVENLEYNMKCLRSILEKLISLRCLALVPASGSCSVNTLPANPSTMCIACDSLCIMSPAPVNLQRLELPRRCCIFSRVPKWIGELHKLCILKIAVRELSTEDTDILKGMPALTALSLHVELSMEERIVFGKEGFSALTKFKFMCTVPWLKFEAGAMPNLEKLKICFSSQIVDEQGTTGIIVIEHLLSLKEISAIIGSAGVDSGSAWRKAIRNDPRNPKVQLMGSIYYGDQRRGMVTHQRSGEDENNEADIRVHTQLESSSLPVPDQPFVSSTLISISHESETMDGHTGQVMMHGNRPGGGGHSDSGGGLSQGRGGAHGGGSLGTQGEVNPAAAPREPIRGEGSGKVENKEADFRIHKQPESSRLPVPAARCKEEEQEDRPSVSEIISIPSESECTDEHTSQVVESWRDKLERSERDILVEQVRVCAEIGIECITSNPAKRPDTKHIMNRLNKYNANLDMLYETMNSLDPDIRRCLEYCSIFSRGSMLRRDDLICLWIAQGFIKTSCATEDMEDIAGEYIQDLVSLSFLEAIGTSSDNDCFTVNDAVHGILDKVATKCFRIENASNNGGEVWEGDVPRNIEHLFIQHYDGEFIMETITGLEYLRTLIVYIVGKDTPVEEKVIESICKRLPKLRVLAVAFSQEHDPIEQPEEFSFPESVGQLEYLRYLAFRGKRVCKITLPSTINKLHHIQVLDFGYGEIAEFTFAELVNLRHIFCWQYVKLAYVGKLSSLQTLPGFKVSNEQGCELKELRDLNKLQGELCISGLQNVKSKGQALQANLTAKERLTELSLFWVSANDTRCSTEVEADVLEGLCPPVGLQKLELWYFAGCRYPDWMVSKQSGGPKYLQELCLWECSQPVPASGLAEAFPHLRVLVVWYCSWDALPANMEHLTSLKELVIHSCKNIRSLPSLPQSLEEFTLRRCNAEFTKSCKTAGHPNWEKIEHIPKKEIW